MKNRQREILFITGGIGLFVSCAGAYLLPLEGFLKALVMVPGIGSILMMPWKTTKASSVQNPIRPASVSRTRCVSYDTHVVFCEEYMERVKQGLEELIIQGPNEKSMSIGNDLAFIRSKYSPFLLPDAEAKLNMFEKTLIEIGVQRAVSENLAAYDGPGRVIREIHAFFKHVLGQERQAKEREMSVSKEGIVEHVRNILGKSILAALRHKG